MFYATVSPMDNHGYFSFVQPQTCQIWLLMLKNILEVNSTALELMEIVLSIFPRSQPFVTKDPITEVISGEITEIDR